MWQTQRASKGTTPSATQTVTNLKKDRIKAKKSLGQNFLTDDGILRNIVAAAGVRAGDLVLEVGPGTGNLTKHLLERGARVTAVEKDDTLYARLAEEYAQEPNLKLVRGDVLRKDLDNIIQAMVEQERSELAGIDAAAAGKSAGAGAGTSPSDARSSPKIKVVANLPYNITKDFLIAMLPKGEAVAELSIMIQEEAAQRLVDPTPKRPDYRSMNVRVNFYSQPVYRFLIPKEKYYPAPGVDGALVTFKLRPPGERPDVGSERGFFALVGKAFLSRRKMMRNSVEPLFTTQQVEDALAASGLRRDARAQDLALSDFVNVYASLRDTVSAELLGGAAGAVGAGGLDEDMPDVVPDDL